VSIAFAQGADVYKAQCLRCHGAAGVPSPALAKMLGVKPATDASVKSKTEAQMIADTTNGMGKMQPFKGKITEGQIKEAVDYFRTFAK
jgi:mono/diheme cytochrome c family protein